MARVHRIGQTQTSHVYRFCTSGTIEQRVQQRAEKKLFLDQMVNAGHTECECHPTAPPFLHAAHAWLPQRDAMSCNMRGHSVMRKRTKKSSLSVHRPGARQFITVDAASVWCAVNGSVGQLKSTISIMLWVRHSSSTHLPNQDENMSFNHFINDILVGVQRRRSWRS